MGSITLSNVGVVVAKPLFQDLSFTLADGDRLGLVAGNGGGKSTLLRCLAGRAEPSEGNITTSRGLRVALVEQDVPDKLLDLPLAEALRRAIPPAERDSQSWRVEVVLDDFGAAADMHERPLRALSGADRPRLGRRARRPAARRADQPSRPREDPPAGGVGSRPGGAHADGDR